MDRTVKFFEDGTEVISRYTGTHFTYVRGRIQGEIKQFGSGGSVTKFKVVASNGKDKEGNWRDGTFYECTAFREKGQQIYERYSDKDEIELILKFSVSKNGDKYYSGFNVVDIPRIKASTNDNPYPLGGSGANDFEEVGIDDDFPPF